MATPHVSGVVSLMLAVNPSLNPAQVAQRLQQTARAFPTGTGADCNTALCGAGIVDAAASVSGLASSPPVEGWTKIADEGQAFAVNGTPDGPLRQRRLLDHEDRQRRRRVHQRLVRHRPDRRHRQAVRGLGQRTAAGLGLVADRQRGADLQRQRHAGRPLRQRLGMDHARGHEWRRLHERILRQRSAGTGSSSTATSRRRPVRSRGPSLRSKASRSRSPVADRAIRQRLDLDLAQPSGGGQCTNEFFGNDPLVGIVKQCEAASTAVRRWRRALNAAIGRAVRRQPASAFDATKRALNQSSSIRFSSRKGSTRSSGRSRGRSSSGR